MNNITDINSMRPHRTAVVECSLCAHKWRAVYPDNYNKLECPNCHKSVNEYGTEVYVNTCKSCGREYSICPKPVKPEDWQYCLSKDCSSYDPDRDCEDLFE